MRGTTDRQTKSTPFEWIGDIPEHWSLRKFRHCFQESSETNGFVVVGEMLSISGYRGVEVKQYSSDSQKRDAEQLETYRVVRRGQLAMNTMWLNYAGLGVSEFEGHMSPAYRAYNFTFQANPRFIHYLLRSSSYVEGYTSHLQGVRPNSLQMSRESLMNLPVLIPPIKEQEAIVDFLDRELAQIDALIDKQGMLIANLIDRKASVITRYVNRGVSEKVEFRDSGVDWIGEIPSSWRVWRIKHACRLTLGKMVNQQNQEGVLAPYVRAGNIQGSGLDLTEIKYLPATDAELSSLQILLGDVLVVEGGAGYGRSVYLPEDLEGWIFQNHVIRLRPFLGFSGRYLDYFIKHLLSVGHFERLSNFATIPSVSADKLGNIELPRPPLDEQIVISDHLDSIISGIDLTLKKSSEFVTILHERRQSLISAAVTGKIDVRKVA